MPKLSGTDAFTDGFPGICSDCFLEQTRSPHPAYYYCEHNQQLAVQVDGCWEPYQGIAPEQVAGLVSSCA